MRSRLFRTILINCAGLSLLAGCALVPKSDPGATTPAKAERVTPRKPAVQASPEQRQKFSRALADIQTGRLDKAEALLLDLVEQEPKLAAAHNNLGIVYRRRGEFDKAESAYSAALAAEPDNAKAHLNLGILYDIYLQQPAQALSHYEKYQSLSQGTDKEVALWIAELKQRL